MIKRKLSEILESGEIARIRVSDNIQFDKANNPEIKGMFVRFGEGGLLSGYKAKDQDIHWEDSDTSEAPLSSTEIQLLSVTLTEDLLVADNDGSYQLSFAVTNIDKKSQDMDIIIKSEGTEVDRRTISVAAEASIQTYVLAGSPKSDWSSGSTISISFNGSAKLTINGGSLPTKIVITKAQAAPIV